MASKNKNNKNSSSKTKKSTKKNSMDGTRQQLMKQKQTRSSTNSQSKTPRTPPKYSNGKTGKSTGSKSISIMNSTSSNSTPKGAVLRFDQPLKRKRKNNNMNNNNRNNDNNHNHNNNHAGRPTFQFKIGMQVGVALGDCFLQLQKLENSMDKLRNVSEDITDVMQCLEQMGGTDHLKNRKRTSSKGDKNNNDLLDEIEDPIEEVHVLNDNLCKWQKDASKRMKNVSVTVNKLQNKLQDLDEYHILAQAQAQAIQTEYESANQTEIDKAMDMIDKLRQQIEQKKMELTQKNLAMQQLKKSTSEPNHNILIDKLDKLKQKEKELNRDAEIIATQSEELRKESERLLAERDEVRKQKENWQKMIDEVKEQKIKLEKREGELQANHKKLLELHETLSEEKKKLHKKAKKIKAREKRLNALRSVQSQYVLQQQQHQYTVPCSNGSDYAESELTYFSDGDTEIASVNSISDDESNDNYYKQQKNTIGLSVGGGARDVNNFRTRLNNGQMPNLSSISYLGMFNEYYFDTRNKLSNTNMGNNNDEKKNEEKDSDANLFYPSYCYAKSKQLEEKEYDYYMTVGLNSNIKMCEFKRKKLNLVIVLDKSGSMSSQFNSEYSGYSSTAKTKMIVANEAVIGLLSLLNNDDSFGILTFNDSAQIIQSISFIRDINLDVLNKKILNIGAGGGTNFEVGFKKGLELYEMLNISQEDQLIYDNRIIYLTDACPNIGDVNPKSLMNMVKNATKLNDNIGRIYTSFIGVGLDFNAKLISNISAVRGCNYVTVQSTENFMNTMTKDFEYFVTPLVFNVKLILQSEGNSCTIDKVFGCGENSDESKAILNGEIAKIETLFAAPKKIIKKTTEIKVIKGGIILIKLLKSNVKTKLNVNLIVEFENRNGKKYINKQCVCLDENVPVNQLQNNDMVNDMIDDDDIDNINNNFYDNTGIQKGILLSRYVTLIKQWIKEMSGSNTLNVNDKFKAKFTLFSKYFENEMKQIDDKEMEKELKILKKLAQF